MRYGASCTGERPCRSRRPAPARRRAAAARRRRRASAATSSAEDHRRAEIGLAAAMQRAARRRRTTSAGRTPVDEAAAMRSRWRLIQRARKSTTAELGELRRLEAEAAERDPAARAAALDADAGRQHQQQRQRCTAAAYGRPALEQLEADARDQQHARRRRRRRDDQVLAEEEVRIAVAHPGRRSS